LENKGLNPMRLGKEYWIENITVLLVIITSFSIGFWSYTWLCSDPSVEIAQLVGLGATIVGFFLFVVIVKEFDL